MPEMQFRIRWPSGDEDACYSPSLVIKDFFEPGQSYDLADFLARSRQALTIASDRVALRYGRPCSLALAQLQRIETTGGRFADDGAARVTVLSFQDGPQP